MVDTLREVVRPMLRASWRHFFAALCLWSRRVNIGSPGWLEIRYLATLMMHWNQISISWEYSLRPSVYSRTTTPSVNLVVIPSQSCVFRHLHGRVPPRHSAVDRLQAIHHACEEETTHKAAPTYYLHPPLKERRREQEEEAPWSRWYEKREERRTVVAA